MAKLRKYGSLWNFKKYASLNWVRKYSDIPLLSGVIQLSCQAKRGFVPLSIDIAGYWYHLKSKWGGSNEGIFKAYQVISHPFIMIDTNIKNKKEKNK